VHRCGCGYAGWLHLKMYLTSDNAQVARVGSIDQKIEEIVVGNGANSVSRKIT
jgi:hypothetical protein